MGTNAVFTVTAIGSPVPTYQWKKGDVAINGATAQTLTLVNVQLSDAADYTVVVSNSEGSVTSETATLTVNPAQQLWFEAEDAAGQSLFPPFEVVADAAASGGQYIRALVASTGSPPATGRAVFHNSIGGTAALWVRWFCPANSSDSLWIKYGDGDFVNVTNSGGALGEWIWKKVGEVTGEATLTIAHREADMRLDRILFTTDLHAMPVGTGGAVGPMAPVITQQPVSQTVAVGAMTSLAVIASGNPAPSYQWKKDGGDIPGAMGASLVIIDAQKADSGSYQVVVSNTEGSAASSVATLTVLVPPAITGQPQSQTVAVGDNPSFTVVATGDPTLGYQWRKNGVSIAGATSATLSLPNVQQTDSGQYTVVVSNPVGAVTSAAAELSVLGRPVIVQQPVSQAVAAGGSTSFTVVAVDSARPVPQNLKRNGKNFIGGAATFC